MSKKMIRMISLVLIAAILVSGCGHKASNGNGTAGSSASSSAGSAAISSDTAEASASSSAESEPIGGDSEPPVEAAEPEPAKYEFNPHLYVPMLDSDIPQDYWDSFHNLCDALRTGETTFECSSEEAYQWATDPATLNQLFPAACTKVKGTSDDGSTPFENGIGRIYYQMPIDEYVERQAEFEALVADILNTNLESGDDEFEKCLKLYSYMSHNYDYQYDFVEAKQDGANYVTILSGEGQCVDLAGVYAYLLLQAGVEALEVGGHAPDMDHDWDYLVIDGKGYYSDPTWGLTSGEEEDPIPLIFFLMTTERRADDGFDMEDLTAPLLPRYWVSFSSVEFSAEDDEYCFPGGSFLESIDQESKIVHYRCNGEECEFHYAQE